MARARPRGRRGSCGSSSPRSLSSPAWPRAKSIVGRSRRRRAGCARRRRARAPSSRCAAASSPAGLTPPQPPSAIWATARTLRGAGAASPGQASSQLLHGLDPRLGLAAAGRNPRRLRRDISQLHARPRLPAQRPRRLTRTTRPARRRESHRSSRGGTSSTRLPRSSARNGSSAGRVNTTAFAIPRLCAPPVRHPYRAIRRAGRVSSPERRNRRRLQFAGRGGPSEIDDTGAALQVLAAGAVSVADDCQAGRELRRPPSDGDWLRAGSRGAPSDAQLTAWVVQGLLAVGRDPANSMQRRARPDGLPAVADHASGEVHYPRPAVNAGPGHRTGARRAVAKPFPSSPSNALSRRVPPHPRRRPHATPKPVKVQLLPPVATATPGPAPALEAVAQVPAASAPVTALMNR